MVKLLVIALGCSMFAACAGEDDDGGGMIVPMPDACEAAEDCELSRRFAEMRCQAKYACDPTYSKDLTDCVADELAALCESGHAVTACSLNGCRRQQELPPCLGALDMCGDPVSCLTQPPNSNCAP